MDGASAGQRTYLRLPHHPPSIPDDLLTIQTHCVVADESNRDLQVSVPANGPTRSYRRIEAESGKLEVSNTLYMDYRWRRRISKA